MKLPTLTLILNLLCLLFLACKKETEVITPNATDCLLTETEQAVIAQIETNFAYPFDGAVPTIEDTNLQPMIDYLSNAKFVGLGEATHGTQEFYQIKDKIFRQLVMQKGFRAIIFEIPWGNALVVNDFVTQGIGTANSSIDQTYYWTYDTQEVRALVQWMRDYNENLPEEERILFVGCDVQGGNFEEEKKVITSYLEKVMPDSIALVLDAYKDLPFTDLFSYANSSASVQEKNIEGTAQIYDFFVAHEEEMIAATSYFEYQVVLMAAHVVQHRELVYRTQDFGWTRDSLMALYSEWWQHILGEETQVALWAHNAHVMNGASLAQNWMGTYLKARQGENYKNVGFSFGQGSFNAFLAGASAQAVGNVRRQAIGEPVCRTVNYLLNQVEGDQYYLIFDELTGEAQSYFNSTQKFIQLGAGFNVQYIDRHYTREYRLSALFDVLIHFDRTRESLLK
ncbi:MAG: erythromycin esterase family protein [Bacteroidota bacterium]